MHLPALKYMRVRDYLRSLVTHELEVGDVIPSERLLCERFGVSRMTVRQAVDALVVEGLLEREQGRGTFVAPSKVDLEVRLVSYGEEMRRRGMEPSSLILAAEEVAAAPDVADALDLAPGEQVFYLHRVRLADGEPMAIEQSWVPLHLVPGLFDGDVPDSIYGELRSRGLAPSGAKTRWRPARSTPATPHCSASAWGERSCARRAGRSRVRPRASTRGPPTGPTATCCGCRSVHHGRRSHRAPGRGRRPRPPTALRSLGAQRVLRSLGALGALGAHSLRTCAQPTSETR